MRLKPGLHIISTPIGNLEDITLRALNILKNSDFILCEDTRVTSKLLAKYNIKKALKIYNDTSSESFRLYVAELIRANKVISLVSDAGTPLISDPGYKLVRYLKQENMHIDVAPGACAAITAITLSGIATNQFYFYGFLPKTIEAKKQSFEYIKDLDCSIIFYETSSRLLSSLLVALDVLGDREANVARELTKLYQESKTLCLSELISYYQNHLPKGEIVLTIEARKLVKPSADEIKAEINTAILQKFSAKTITANLHEKYKKFFKKQELYKITNELVNSK